MSEVEQNLELEQDKTEETGGAEKPEKKELTPEQKLGIARRSFTKLATELGVEVTPPWHKKPESAEAPKETPKEKKEFDDTENLLLDIKNVHAEDRDWLFKEHQTTGKNLRNLLSFKYVQEQLNETRQKRETEAGLPSGNNRAGGGASNTAEGWLAKIESGKAKLSDVPDNKLRSEIVRLRENNSAGTNRPNW